MSERSLERWMHQLPCGSRAREDYNALKARIKELAEKYNDVLYQVQNKIPSESRHETAKRIINQHENREAQCDSNIAKNTMTQK